MPNPVPPVDTGNNGLSAVSWIILAIKSIIESWDNITFFNNSFSLLDLFIAVLAMGVIISVLLSTVPNFALNASDYKYNREIKAEREKEKAERDKRRQEYYNRRNKNR